LFLLLLLLLLLSAGGAGAGGDSARGASDGAARPGAAQPGEEETRSYCIHWRRAQNGSNKDALAAFRESPQARMLAEATKTARRPDGVAVGVKLLVKGRCTCIKPRRSAECDCKICSVVHHNLPIYSKSRQIWRKHAEQTGECVCGTCSEPDTRAAWLGMAKSLRALESTLLPCGKVPYTQISFAEGPPFEMYHRACTRGDCGHAKPLAFRPPCPGRAGGNGTPCGWARAFPKQCPIEYSETDRMRWHAWEPRLRGTSKDGSAYMADELVPRDGPRAQFMGELRTAVEAYLPHIWEVRLMRHACRLMEARKDQVTATRHSDYASQLPIVRASTGTCQSKESINNCVSVIGFKPRDVEVPLRRPAEGTRTARRQTVLIAFGMFDNSYKADARSFNVQAADLDSILKCGKSIHGEWFYKGKRLPGGKLRAALPDGITDYEEAQPFFPEMERVVEVTDGSPTQFDNRTHYHQTASWRARMNIIRMAIKLITMHGKSVCDGASNAPKYALVEAGAQGALFAPGARGALLYLVQAKPTPSKAKIDGGGLWQADGLLYGYYDTSLFTGTAVPDALPFTGSSKVHMSCGLCDDMDQAVRNGPLTHLDVFCPCAPCCRFDFARCEMTHVFGKVKVSNVVRATSTGLPSQTASLQDFASGLDKDKVVAFRVESDEHTIEGCVWLALFDVKAFSLEQDELHAGQHFQKGWTVVRGHWFSLARTDAASGTRTYKALAEEALFNVQAMIKLKDIRFLQNVPKRTRASTADWYKNNEFSLHRDTYQILVNSI
jgi:hypothetical protein